MDKKIVVTISREFGSGGRIIGKKVAEKLGIPFFDREIIEMSAEKGGFSEEFVENNEQKVKNKFFHNFVYSGDYMNGYAGSMHVSMADKLFLTTCETIEHIAENSCVIVGRCADFILKDRKEVFNIFIYADHEHKVKRAVEVYGQDPKTASADVKRTDKHRANHYEYYTERKWGVRNNYHLCVNSGLLGVDSSADLIADAVKDYIKAIYQD